MRIRATALALLAGICVLSAPAASQAATPAPAWQLSGLALPTNLVPGSDTGHLAFLALNVGAASADGGSDPIVFEDTLPPGLTPTAAKLETPAGSCTLAPPSVTCTTAETLPPGGNEGVMVIVISLEVSPAPGPAVSNEATVRGGGAPADTLSQQLSLSAADPPFGFLEGEAGLAAPLTEADGAPATAAASHPYQLLTQLGFPVRKPAADELSAAGHLRDAVLDLPPGELVDPAATPLRCTEVQLLSPSSCPPSSQIGLALVITPLFNQVFFDAGQPLFNMVPPPGEPSSFAFLENGIAQHVLGSLRSDSDYGLSGRAEYVLGRGSNPILATEIQFWGDPSGESHDAVRGSCAEPGPDLCPVAPGESALITAPERCQGTPEITRARIDDWEAPGTFIPDSYEAADLQGNPATLSGCNALEYQPSISSQPSTNLADSPAGLQFDLRQPQEQPQAEPLSGRATAELRDARVTLPEGLVANPSQADGLAACAEAQIGYLGEGHYSKLPQSCPDAAKLGTLEVSSPLLAQYSEEGTKTALDPETGEPIPRPLHGSVYLAKPYENQFSTLLAIYLVVEDEESGIVAKLAGRVEPDPATGRLTTVFEENPELPLSDIHLSLAKGARASLTTPLACGTYTTTSDLTPWSTPEGQDAHPESSFQTIASPNGGSCPTSEAAALNKPTFQAGTLAPQAGAFSPFVLKLHREDGSQRLTGIDTTLPPGLTGKLAGIGECSEAQIAQAKSREKPDEGIIEREHPSCPASTEVGSVKVAAGSGPTPFWTSGHAYLAGPYKGAPLSLAVIVPALAGPFDLGAVVTRVALHVDPATAQIHAISDPLPTILDGIPLDLRTVSLEMGRPEFTLNPTSCDRMSLTGTATAALGGTAGLSNPFQVGGCSTLPFKPKIALKLKGATKRTGHPKLIASVYSQGAGVANLSRVQVKLPPTAFLDQAHIRTVCTRVQFAAGAGNGAACPKGSVYGEAQVKTPLFDYTLPGTVYLRSSSHKLPDLVIALNGPADQPIAIELDGRTDSVKGALRNTFEYVPDQPFEEATVVLFGGKRGLVVNSRDLCAQKQRANVQLNAQSGKVLHLHPLVRNSCKGARRRHHRRHGL